MLDVLRNTLMITGFVFVMMLVIEFVNVLTSGAWQKRLTSSRFGQYLLAAVLGAIPGCLGSFAVVAMYSHRVLTFGAVVTAMIATSGDEAFVMLAMIPRQAIIITGILFITGIVVGMASDFFLKKTGRTADYRCGKMVVHDEHAGRYVDTSQLVSQWRHCTAARGVLAVGLVLLIVGIATGQIGHTGHESEQDLDSELIAELEVEADLDHETDLDHEAEHDHSIEILEDGHAGHGHGEGWDWVRITMLVTSIVALSIVVTVSDHFLEEHLWDHIARRHLPRVFLWTLGALVALYLLTDLMNIDLKTIAGERRWFVLVFACLAGLIPQSGPHLIFVSLFASGIIPFSVLLANSVVQDGHGMLPLLADSRRSFIMIKAINLVAGLALGAASFAAGF